jgi:beta-phosphoglucomutase
MSFKGAIFDLDGVLVDTVPLHVSSWEKLFTKNYHVPFSYEIYQKYVDGKSRFDAIRLLLPQLSEREIIYAGELKQKYFLELINIETIKKFDDASVLIEKFIKYKIQLAAASSSKNAVLILEKVELLKKFQIIISGNDFTRGKPDPEIFLSAARAMNLDAKECVVFEDSWAGIQAAKAGGFFCVGIDRYNYPKNYSLADLHVTDLTKVNYEMLENFFK